MNEFDASVQNLEKEKKEARIKIIRQTIARAEREIAGNFEVVDPNTTGIESIPSAEFYSKVRTFNSIITDTFDENGNRRPTYWDTFEVELSNDGLILDETYVRDLILISIIEANGLSLIAPDYETACGDPNYYKFYLNKLKDTVNVKNVDNKLRDKAGAKLVAMEESDSNKLFYITKLISYDSMFYKEGKNSTPVGILYEECTKFLDGKAHMNKTEACRLFIEYANMNMKDLIPRTLFKDGKETKTIVLKDSMWYHYRSQTLLGKNEEDVVAFLKSDANSKTYESLLNEMKVKWTE